MYTARCDERKGRRSGRGACPRRFRSVRRLASGVAAFRAIAWNELHGAKWMANGGPASLAAVRWPRQRLAVWSAPLSRKRCPFRGMSGKRACFLWGSVFPRTPVHPGKKHQGAGAFSAPLQHHRRCRTGLAMAPASRDKASVPRRRRACGAALASSRAMTRASQDHLAALPGAWFRRQRRIACPRTMRLADPAGRTAGPPPREFRGTPAPGGRRGSGGVFEPFFRGGAKQTWTPTSVTPQATPGGRWRWR